MCPCGPENVDEVSIRSLGKTGWIGDPRFSNLKLEDSILLLTDPSSFGGLGHSTSSPTPILPPKSSKTDPSNGEGNTGAGSNANPFTALEWEAMGSETRGLFDFGTRAAVDGGATKQGDDLLIQKDPMDMGGSTPFSGVCSNIPARHASPLLSRIVDVPQSQSSHPLSPSTSFSTHELSSIAGADRFVWRCLPASGHSGGILLGARVNVFDFVALDHGIFWASMVVYHRTLNVVWEVMVVYGLSDHSLSLLFLDEHTTKIDSCNIPLVIGDDFNLLRFPTEKSDSNFSWHLADAFNDFIAACALHELPRTGSRFTWSNHQTNSIRSMLDRVLVTSPWDLLFHRASLSALPHIR
ncbi:hypothetical protein D1007_29411 [Hordeum vulgare]|nr:hypothetical protein D1007_29411 [Hordeum vulgare]